VIHSMKNKKRLDQFLVEQHPEYSRQQIQSWIMQGKVFVDDQKVVKAGAQVTEGSHVELRAEPQKYVSRAGLKLEKALDHFAIDVKDLVVLDAGLSTGGFTDCMLQHGAKKVYGVDVGYGQVHEKVASDPRLEMLERTNLRMLESVGQKVDLITLDLSFISVLKVMEAVVRLLKDDGQLLVLIKPQFESQKHEIGPGGIIKDAKIHEAVVARVTAGVAAHGFEVVGVIDSPILGTTGNKEFLAYFKRTRVAE
jgi:23S rRNA (cytidine1920-2'-O)/16S rRNA (cytidine1409-2'-O)-methyltransferase